MRLICNYLTYYREGFAVALQLLLNKWIYVGLRIDQLMYLVSKFETLILYSSHFFDNKLLMKLIFSNSLMRMD